MNTLDDDVLKAFVFLILLSYKIYQIIILFNVKPERRGGGRTILGMRNLSGARVFFAQSSARVGKKFFFLS